MILRYAEMTMRVLAIGLPPPPHVWVGSAVGIVPLDRALLVNTAGSRAIYREPPGEAIRTRHNNLHFSMHPSERIQRSSRYKTAATLAVLFGVQGPQAR